MDWFAALFRASGGRVVDFTNYMLVSMQKTFSNRETPIGRAPTHYYIGYNHSRHLAVDTLHAM